MLQIYTFAHKRPDFVVLQIHSFNKYLQEPFEFTVFNVANFDMFSRSTLNSNYNEIHRICGAYGIKCIDVERDQALVNKHQGYEPVQIFSQWGELGNPCIACAYPLCWGWDNFICKQNDPVLILDSDMFLLKPSKFSPVLEKHHICYVPQNSDNIEYMWNGIILTNPAIIPDSSTINWFCGNIKGNIPVDVGGQTYRYLETHTELSTLYIGQENVWDDPELNFHPSDYQTLWIENNPVLHYRRGSNWLYRDEEYHRNKTAWLVDKLAL
jgi:hypothetical protein